uniref:Uncharacterized protein n=1 Tax=viral metagenome TaxID=1070528 RepID=A0A6M3JU11_9ZZZZ
MKARFYIAPQKGIGTEENPYRSILNDFINIHVGEWFDEIDHPARHISICCVHAGDTVHANILIDAKIFPISPLFNDESEISNGLNLSFDSIFNISAIKTKLEEHGINTAWISKSNTLKDVLRYLLRNFAICQIIDGQGLINVKEVLKKALVLTVAEISQAQRIAVRDWIQSKGLAVGWINNQTTIREIVHFIVGNLGLGKFRMSGVEF